MNVLAFRYYMRYVRTTTCEEKKSYLAHSLADLRLRQDGLTDVASEEDSGWQ